ncbi:MAG: TetR/AcrR family transcriptional regulator [Roseibium sp.]|uniref:TetR/AcrR family transcriptional regulator n=1 Tax=Roseibium sp. TaxID=1936156 RepID=UPI001B041F6D|nr:TetR/AcrR family transcriptional regulator [Roseibium sp.]MBO6892121.1 TetR/AcrR family transcriptional regulator [Roseibium sp.]MBO6931543.1 TetR/AcrR family transcriptional regulator [Roseibium sp.]
MSVSDQKKKQIIEAAIAEFQEKGFAGASMDRISERAQVSKRTVYNHFESKEVLFKGINQCLADQINTALEFPYDPDLPIRDTLVRLGWAEGELMISPCFMSLARMIMSETIRDPELAADMNARMTKLSVFAEYIQRATGEGKLSADDPGVAAEQFLGLIKSRAFYPNIYASRVPERDEMEKIIEESVDLFLAKYGT